MASRKVPVVWSRRAASGCWRKRRCPERPGAVWRRCVMCAGITLLLLQPASARHGDGQIETSNHPATSAIPTGSSNVSSSVSPLEVDVDSLLQSQAPPAEAASSTREQAVFSSVLTVRANSDSLVQYPAHPHTYNLTNHKIQEDPPPKPPQTPTKSVLSTNPEEAPLIPDLLTTPGASISTLTETKPSHSDNVTSSVSPSTLLLNDTSPGTEKVGKTLITQTIPDTVTSDSLQLTTVTTTMTTSLTVTDTTVTSPGTSPVTTEELTTIAPATTTTETTTISTEPPTTPPTSTTTTTTTTTPITTTTLTTTKTQNTTVATTEAPSPPSKAPPLRVHLQPATSQRSCWFERSGLRQNLVKGLTLALQKAFNDSNVHIQLERDLCTPSNVTLGYYVMSEKTVYMAAAVVETLTSYSFDKLLTDLRQHAPVVLAIPIPVASWQPSLGIHLQLKTVLRFVGPTDNIKSCAFIQIMEQRLGNVFSEAQEKVEDFYGNLSVEILNTYQAGNSLAVSLVYVVWNGSVALNGTVASALINQLSAELVGYFLFFPPMIIAEPLEYHNLNTSVATREYWVITVIQDVDSSSLEGSYQSFASLMEQRLAELFLVAGRHGIRIKRATTVGGYTVQMVSIRRLAGPKNPAEMTYYVQVDGAPITGTSAAKTLNMVDSQTMALTLGYFVQIQAEPVVKSVPSNLWILAVLTPVSLVIVVIVMAIAIICRRNRNVFKSSAFRGFHQRTKTSYRRDGSYHHQPVQGFDYAKQHMGQQGEETLAVTKETLVLSLPVRDAPLTQDKGVLQDGTTSKRQQSTEILRSKLPSEDGSVSSNGSAKLNTARSSSAHRNTIQKVAKEETHTRTEHYDSLTGSLRLISIKPMAAPLNYSYPDSSNHSQDSIMLNGEVNMGLKQKSDIEHYRNKLRLKAKRKGYNDGPSSSGGHRHSHRDRLKRDNASLDLEDTRRPAEDRNPSTYVKYRRSESQREPTYWSRQSLNTPSPVETELDLLVMRERARRGIRNSGYDAEPEPFEETDVDRLMSSLGFGGTHHVKGHSDSSTLSSQPSIDEVRQQMHLLLDNAFGLASAEPSGRNHHQHHSRHGPHPPYPPAQSGPYVDGVTSAPGTMDHPAGALQRGPSFEPDMHQCSLPKPGFRFTQLPDMGLGSPPPLISARTGAPPGASVRRSTPDMSLKPRVSEASEMNQHNGAPYLPINRAPFPAVTVDQSMSSYSGNPMTAVYAISANRPGYSDYFVLSPSSSYRSPSWMSYPPEPDDLPRQWGDTNPCHLETIC
ncbi:hypothetical protein HF521_018867 [Silurus meridionalis]|uniref:Uncharacterized protein n=1 Tax=Silurus meridionalis TaxID=175797 RepID=A0A8T0BKL8_SILME|nr:hypothetical protein HF521_018867 [Silurus meridionalis]